MKKLSEVYVITEVYGKEFDFFKEYVSFDKEELKPLLDEMNGSFLEITKRSGYPPLAVKYKICTLEEAIDQFREYVADANTSHEESY